jgi:hypothetical protein
MSSDPDRIAVPTNGRRPHPVTATPPTEPPAKGAVPAATTPALPRGVSPQQLMLGFGIIASLVAIAAGLARRRVRR